MQSWVVVIGLLLSNPDPFMVDKGMVDGLRLGDPVEIFYTLSVGNVERRIEVTGGRVVRITDTQAWLELDDTSRVRAGHSFECRVPADRTSLESLLDLAREREEEGDLAAALLYFERMQKVLPDDLLVQRSIERIRRKQAAEEERRREMERVVYYRDAARQLLAEGDPGGAAAYIEKVLALIPGDAETLAMREQLDQARCETEQEERARAQRTEEEARRVEEQKTLLEERERRREAHQKLAAAMISVPSGVFRIGVPLFEAKAYNQTPVFEANLQPFLIDPEPVKRADFVRVLGQAAKEVSSKRDGVTAVTFEEASRYCELAGKRLPTEFEWEAAQSVPGVSRAQISEWTSSWYLPYPGNVVYEDSYGEKYRVLRGPEKTVRYFMDPTARDSEVGFRCAAE